MVVVLLKQLTLWNHYKTNGENIYNKNEHKKKTIKKKVFFPHMGTVNSYRTNTNRTTLHYTNSDKKREHPQNLFIYFFYFY